jgi:hypothetical protein
MTLDYKILGQLYYGPEIDQNPDIPGSGYYISTVGEEKDVYLSLFYFAPAAYYSNDAITWTIVNTGVTQVTDPVYINGKFMVISGGQTLVTSVDGINWSSPKVLPNPSGQAYYGNIVFNNGIFISIDASQSPDYIYSTDGDNWTAFSRGSNLYGLIVADEKFVAAYNVTIQHTVDGISWVENSLPQENGNMWRFPKYGNGTFVLSSSLGYPEVATSTDLINWSVVPVALTQSVNATLKFLNDKFYLFGSYGNSAYSVDGINWTSFNMPDSLNTYYDNAEYYNGVYIAWSMNYYAYSLDGYNWNSLSFPLVSPEALSNTINYGGGKFTIISSYMGEGFNTKSRIYYSADGINWNPSNMPLNDPCTNVGYGKINTLREVQTLIGGQGIPGSYVETIEPQVLYTVPEGAETVITSIYVTNSDIVERSYDLAIVPKNESMSLKHHIRWDNPISPKLFDIISAKITLSSGDRVYVFPSTIDKIAFTAFGVEKI